MTHIAVDGSLHDSLESECASCRAMIEDGYVNGLRTQRFWLDGGSFDNAKGAKHLEVHQGTKGAIHQGLHGDCTQCVEDAVTGKTDGTQEDWVNPQHYRRGPTVRGQIVQCIEIVRTIRDYRLATAFKYIWRVAYGGKINDREDIAKAIWYLQDWLDNPMQDS